MSPDEALDRAGIAARIPHSGAMALLDALQSWSAQGLHCSAISHRDPANPLRSQGRLPATAAIEYAAQAMALHGALACPEGSASTAGFLASVRAVRLQVARLDDIEGPLHIAVQRLAGDAAQALYAFTLDDERGRRLAEGRAAVILNSLP